jgi:hypothetical protein
MTDRRQFLQSTLELPFAAGGLSLASGRLHAQEPWPTRTITIVVREALADATVKQRYVDMGQELPPPEQQTPEALAAYQKAEIEKWWPIIKAANIKAE